MGLIITLIVIGIVLLVVEMLFIPGFGVPGIFGIVSLVGANFIAFSYHSQLVGVIVLLTTIVSCSLVVAFALRAKTWNRLSLKHNIEAKATPLPAELGIEIGMQGVTLGRLSPAGKARFGNADIEVYAQQGMIDPGVTVEVVHVENLRIFVALVTE